MEITDPAIEAYLRDLQPDHDPVRRRLQQEGEAAGFPIIGPLVGRMCHLLATIVGAKRIFELGSGFGYSTAWFAPAVGPDGTVVHTDLDPDNTARARAAMQEMGLDSRVQFEVGDALETAHRIGGEWDIVFCDIDKQDYPAALEWATHHLRPGGLLLVDNVLWSGAVLDPDLSEPMTKGVVDFTAALAASDAFDWTIVPIRDGVAVGRRRHHAN